MHIRFACCLLPVLLLACGGADNGDPSDLVDAIAPDTVTQDAAPDVPDVSDPDVPEDADLPAEDVPDAGADTPEDGIEDAGDVSDLPPFEDVAFPPRKLAFAFERPPVGEPVDAAEVTAFTRRYAQALHDTGYFRWLLRTSAGVDASTGHDDYLAWHNDMVAIKSEGVVTFQERGHEENMWIPSAKILSAVMGAYLHTGDWEAAKLTEQYCKGLTAVVKGFVWGDDDPAPWLMARAVFPMDHAFTMDEDNWHDDGRAKRVEFSGAYTGKDQWNCQSFAWPENPAWGDIWVTNMRSKDDVRAITRTVPFLHYVVADAPDAWVRDACDETLQTMLAFHKDIVDEDYFIRTKDRDGVAYRLACDDQKDLGSYNCFTEIDPANECCARMATDMIAYGERRTNDCGTCRGSIFDAFASTTHVYNIPIIWDFHMAGVLSSLVARQHRDAYLAMVGLAERIDGYMHPGPDEPHVDDPYWPSRMAFLLVEAASVGLPLTAHEARHIHEYWDRTAEELRAWPNWDLWDESVADGTYSGWTNWDWWPPTNPEDTGLNSFRPITSPGAVPVPWFATLFEYCMSPLKNPAGAAFVDCEVLRDPATWGADR